ncbi:MAG: DNA-binding protein [Gemmatimonadetes bacterium]|nr:DNA-binding protein [Gemmatimonadota bacterium]
MQPTIELSEAQARQLAEIARRLNVPAESLAEAAVREVVAQPKEDFDRVASRILEKNRELYERLG